MEILRTPIITEGPHHSPARPRRQPLRASPKPAPCSTDTSLVGLGIEPGRAPIRCGSAEWKTTGAAGLDHPIRHQTRLHAADITRVAVGQTS